MRAGSISRRKGFKTDSLSDGGCRSALPLARTSPYLHIFGLLVFLHASQNSRSYERNYGIPASYALITPLKRKRSDTDALSCK